jgi:hypothetical protein
MTAHCISTKRTSHSYYVVMEDFGQRGLEAIVTPETTRRAVVNFIKGGNYRLIAFIHHVDGLFVEDVTDELIDEAEAELKAEHHALRNSCGADHARDYRKHEPAE